MTARLLICRALAPIGVFALLIVATTFGAPGGVLSVASAHVLAAAKQTKPKQSPSDASSRRRRANARHAACKRFKAHSRKRKKCVAHKKQRHPNAKVVKPTLTTPIAPTPATADLPALSLSSPVTPILVGGASTPAAPGPGEGSSGTGKGSEGSPAPPNVSKPVNTGRPSMSGATTEGNTLNASTGTWEGKPTSYAYQWQSCNSSGSACTDIEGETSSTYTLDEEDVGRKVLVIVEATNAAGTTAARSSISRRVGPATTLPPAAPTNTTLPTIGGTSTEGKTLTATNGGWSGSPTSYAYQWQDCSGSGSGCVSISGATSSSYVLVAADVGDTVRVVVTATNAGGSTSATSSVSASITNASSPPPPAPTNTGLPTIKGTAIEGDTLQATAGSWQGSPTTFAYQWQDCSGSGSGCVSISGAMGSSYVLGGSDVGHTVRVVVTATNAGGSTAAASAVSASVVSAPPPPPPSPPSNTSLPTIGGTSTEGKTLTATNGGWSGSPTSYAYQWQDCNSSGEGCASIAGATHSSYKLAAADVGHTVRVAVLATNSGGSMTATSAATGVVAQAVVTTGCTTTISSGLQSAIQSAAAGSVICLNAGNYGNITVTTSKSSMVTIVAAAGLSSSQVTLGYTDVTTSSNLTFEGVTVEGGNVGSSSSSATHIHWVEDEFTSGLCIQAPTSANIDVLVEGSTFIDIDTGGCSNEGRLEVNGDNEGPSGVNGVVIAHDLFQTGSPSGCTDGVNITGGASGTVIGPGDEFTGLKQGSCSAHVDSIQFYGATDTTVTGDYFQGNSDGIMSPDGNGSPMTVSNCVFDTDGEYPDQIVIGGGGDDVITHDTFGHGARVRIGHVNVGATASNETVTDNVLTGGLELTEGQSSSGWTMEYNLVEGEVLGAHSIKGKPVYVGGGSEPSTWAGWTLTSASPGHLAAGDGGDMGANYFGS
ncbi:MAG: hypothetical protein WBV85_11895 [Solirubrobacteraceae bacterium]